ncbi:MAG: gamma carbonic anhydrase family protein [Thiotrichales bacterium]
MIRRFEAQHPRIHREAYVDAAAVVIGDVGIGARSSVWPNAVIRGDVHSIVVGDESNIQDASVLHVTHDSHYKPGGRGLVVGDRVTVGHHVTLHACTLESGCFVGIGCVVLDGAVIETGAMLGAGTLVTPGQRLAGGYLYLGSPARQARALSAEERDYLVYSAEHYVRLAARHAQTRLQIQFEEAAAAMAP